MGQWPIRGALALLNVSVIAGSSSASYATLRLASTRDPYSTASLFSSSHAVEKQQKSLSSKHNFCSILGHELTVTKKGFVVTTKILQYCAVFCRSGRTTEKYIVTTGNSVSYFGPNSTVFFDWPMLFAHDIAGYQYQTLYL